MTAKGIYINVSKRNENEPEFLGIKKNLFGGAFNFQEFLFEWCQYRDLNWVVLKKTP